MAGKIVADTFEGTDSTETVSGASVTLPTSVGSKYIVNGTLKAWSGDTDANGTTINNSLNVSSKTDDGTGDFGYTLINNAFEELDASSFGGMCFGGNRFVRGRANTTTTSVLDILISSTSGAGTDSPHGWMWTGELA